MHGMKKAGSAIKSTWITGRMNIETFIFLNIRAGALLPGMPGRMNLFKSDGKILGTGSAGRNKFEIIFFHFHNIKILSDGNADLGWNRLQKMSLICFIYLIFRK